MKKSLLSPLFIFSFFNSCVFAQFVSHLPASVLSVPVAPTPSIGSISVSTSKANISGLSLPVTLQEQEYQGGAFHNEGDVNVGFAYIFGATNFKVSESDSTILAYGTFYKGVAVLYRSDLFGKHYIPGLILGYDAFALHLGGDVSTKTRPYPEVSLMLNLIGIPFISNLLKLTPQTI